MTSISPFRLKQIVGVSDAKVFTNKEDVLVTYGLRTGVAVVAVDMDAQIYGMLHFQLPCYHDDKTSKVKNPLMYADTGMDYILAKMSHEGANITKLRISVVGGAYSASSGRYKDLGRHNYNAIRRYLWVHDLLIHAEDCGGKNPRNIFCDMETAAVTVKCKGDMLEI